MSGINFGQVEPAKSGSFLEPGMYRLKIDQESVAVVNNPGKTPYLLIKYVAQDGASVSEKFYLTEKSVARLQYYYKAITGKILDKIFSSYLEIGQYFESLFKAKPLTLPMKTGGKIAANGKFYSGLPYTNFIIPEGVDFEEGAFDKDSANYRDVVTIEKADPAVQNSNAPVLPGYSPVGDPSSTPWG